MPAPQPDLACISTAASQQWILMPQQHSSLLATRDSACNQRLCLQHTPCWLLTKATATPQGCRSKGDLQKLNWGNIVRGLLSWAQQQHVEASVPTHMVVPSGSRVAIDYSREAPTVCVRIQEVRVEGGMGVCGCEGVWGGGEARQFMASCRRL